MEFHCNNKGRHVTDPGYKPVCDRQCKDCAEWYPAGTKQMETVQQHEWEYTHTDIFSQKIHKCIHCPWVKVVDSDGDIGYEHPAEEYAFLEEPPCITRTKQPDAGKTKSNT